MYNPAHRLPCFPFGLEQHFFLSPGLAFQNLLQKTGILLSYFPIQNHSSTSHTHKRVSFSVHCWNPSTRLVEEHTHWDDLGLEPQQGKNNKKVS